MNPKSENLIWIDLEMTGLDVANDKIIEIATIVTNSKLEIVAEGPVLAIHQPEAVLQNMGNWCKKQHTASGLVERVQQSAIDVETAQQQTLEFLKQHVTAKKSPMCGNSICMDRRFLAAYMPTLEEFFHYRHIDVSTIKELAKRWKPRIYNGFKKDNNHLALDDIKESIAELRYYRDNFLSFNND